MARAPTTQQQNLIIYLKTDEMLHYICFLFASLKNLNHAIFGSIDSLAHSSVFVAKKIKSKQHMTNTTNKWMNFILYNFLLKKT